MISTSLLKNPPGFLSTQIFQDTSGWDFFFKWKQVRTYIIPRDCWTVFLVPEEQLTEGSDPQSSTPHNPGCAQIPQAGTAWNDTQTAEK